MLLYTVDSNNNPKGVSRLKGIVTYRGSWSKWVKNPYKMQCVQCFMIQYEGPYSHTKDAQIDWPSNGII